MTVLSVIQGQRILRMLIRSLAMLQMYIYLLPLLHKDAKNAMTQQGFCWRELNDYQNISIA